MQKTKRDVPGSSRKGSIDARSSDAAGRQADEVTTHAQRAKAKPDRPTGRKRDETAGALKDETAR